MLNGRPWYKGYTKKRLGARNVATLEKVYEQSSYPDDSMVESVHRATKLPRSKIVAWFKTRREEEKSNRRRAAARSRFDDRRNGSGWGGGDGRGDGFYEERGRGGARRRGGGRGQRRDGPGGGWKGNEDAELRRRGGGGGNDAYGMTDQERGRRDSTSGWTPSGRN